MLCTSTARTTARTKSPTSAVVADSLSIPSLNERGGRSAREPSTWKVQLSSHTREREENIMHWDLASATLSASNGEDTFHFNACLREGAGTNVLKKVTCRSCAPLVEFPRTPLQAANLLYARMLERSQEVTKSPTFCWVTAQCNACTDREVGLNELTYMPEHQAMSKLMGFFTHCAFDHSLGAEPIVRVDYDGISVYAVNLAMGKDSATEAEASWRAHLEVV